MIYERVLLQTIKFDLQVEHPYSILLKIGKLLKGIACVPFILKFGLENNII
jgi:hypothetical protein